MVVKVRTSFKTSGHDPLPLSTLPGFLLTQGESQASPWLQASEICLGLPHYLASPLTLDAPTSAVCTSYSLCLPYSSHTSSSCFYTAVTISARPYSKFQHPHWPYTPDSSSYSVCLSFLIAIATPPNISDLLIYVSWFCCSLSSKMWTQWKAGIAVWLIDLSSTPEQGPYHESCEINIFLINELLKHKHFLWIQKLDGC